MPWLLCSYGKAIHIFGQIKNSLGAGTDLLSPWKSIIGAEVLNYGVRDGNRCTHLAKGTSTKATL